MLPKGSEQTGAVLPFCREGKTAHLAGDALMSSGFSGC